MTPRWNGHLPDNARDFLNPVCGAGSPRETDPRAGPTRTTRFRLPRMREQAIRRGTALKKRAKETKQKA